MPPSETKKIFILRNNDLGDVLLTTPLVRGLKKNFPEAKVFMGVGDWARPLVENNPDLDGIIKINAPWHNKQNCRFPANSPVPSLRAYFMYSFQRNPNFFVSKNTLTELMSWGAGKDRGCYAEAEFPIGLVSVDTPEETRPVKNASTLSKTAKLLNRHLPSCLFLAAKKSGTKTHFTS